MLDRRAQLAQADRQVAEAKTRIRKQEQIVAALSDATGRFVPIAAERAAAKNRYSVTPSARASSVGGTSRLARKDSRNGIYGGALGRLGIITLRHKTPLRWQRFWRLR